MYIDIYFIVIFKRSHYLKLSCTYAAHIMCKPNLTC